MTAAVVLAAGPGSRLGDLGARMPKTMVPVAGRPYLEHLAGRLLGAGIRPVVVAIHHHARTILDHFDRRPMPGLRFVRTEQRGTCADLVQCLDALPDTPFLVWNGDTIVDLDLPDLLASARLGAGCGTIVLTRRAGVPNPDAWFVGADGVVLATLEAPGTPAPTTFAWRGSSSGVLLLTKALLQPYCVGEVPDLYAAVLPALIEQRLLLAYDNGLRYFLDFGTPTAMAQIDHEQVAGWA
jgi:mannose-1-phosphate guanylyltransferase